MQFGQLLVNYRPIIAIYRKSTYITNTLPCASGSFRIDPLRFLSGWHKTDKRRLNQFLLLFGLVCVYVCNF